MGDRGDTIKQRSHSVRDVLSSGHQENPHQRMMSDAAEQEMLTAVARGDERAFERVYEHFRSRVRLVAFRITHRADWIDDLENEAWCRAFRQRVAYRIETPFLVWMAGILRNVYREHCRDSHLTIGDGRHAAPSESKLDEISPEKVAHEAEVLSALNECTDELSDEEATVVRLRYFEGLPLRTVADKLGVPESSLREKTIVKLLNRLRICLERKNIDFTEIFSAQDGGEIQ